MNENHKRRGVALNNKLLIAAAIASLFIGSSNALANLSSSPIENRHEVQEQLQSQATSGTVVDAKGEPIIGASVVEKGTNNGTITNLDGKFSLNVKEGSTLRISFVGYHTQEVKAGNNLKVTLTEDTGLLDEVVVVGYGTQKKANLTGAVSTVDVSKTLESRPQSDVSKALQGVVPGLSIINSSGKLDSEPSITIRGTGTLSNSQTSKPLIIVDGVPMEDISFLNTQDIENISVLKDAASTSIYGARAAFGVLLITTKAAKKVDKVSISYNNNFAWDTASILPNYPDVATQVTGLRAANLRAGLTNELFGMNMNDEFIEKANAWKQRHGGKAGYRPMVAGDDFDLLANGSGLYYADWDVVGIMYRNWKPSQSHNISVQGSSGKTSYYLSLGYNHDEGIMTFNPDDLKKWTTNMTITTDLTKWLQLGGRFSFSDKTFTEANTMRDTYTYMWRWGSFFGPYGTYEGTDMRNDIAYRKQAGDDRTKKTYTRLGAFLKATIIKGLTLNADYTYSLENTNEKSAGLPINCLDSWGGNITAPSELIGSTSTYVFEGSGRDRSYALNVYANYALTLAKSHNFNFMLGGNVEEGEYTYHSSQRRNLLDSNMPEFNLANGDQTVTGAHTEWGTAGWFGRINYDYNGIWLLELNGRYDGSSKFPSSDRWAFFPSFSAGYRMSEEKYFEPIKKVVTNAKLRGSFGEIGNQAVGDNMFISVLTKEKDANVHWLDENGNKVVSYSMPSLVSKTLKWERIQTLDVGADLGFLNNELNASFDWYQRTTLDMLAPGKTLPQVLGADAPKTNAGTLRTRGWEFSIDWRHQFNKVNVYANASIGDFKTVITKWDNDNKLLNDYYSGQVYGDIWGFETDRFFTSDDFNADGSYKDGIASQKNLQQDGFVYGAGDIKFKDLDGNGVIDGGKGTANDHGDLKVIGNTNPRYQYSFRLGGEWNGFDIDLFFQGVGKRDVWTQSAFVMPMMRGADALYENQTNYWTEDNTNAEFPRLWPGNAGQGTISVLDKGNHNFYPQSKYLVHMAYLRFKNLTVGYTLPRHLTQKAFIEKARVYFSANNICELINRSNAPVDPEVNTSQGYVSSTSNDYGNGTWGRVDPMYRTISFGIQVTF